MLDRATLALVAETLADAEDDWWLVGGAAVALQGLDIAIADIDVLMSRRDVVRVIARLGIAPRRRGGHRSHPLRDLGALDGAADRRRPDGGPAGPDR